MTPYASICLVASANLNLAARTARSSVARRRSASSTAISTDRRARRARATMLASALVLMRRRRQAASHGRKPRPPVARRTRRSESAITRSRCSTAWRHARYARSQRSRASVSAPTAANILGSSHTTPTPPSAASTSPVPSDASNLPALRAAPSSLAGSLVRHTVGIRGLGRGQSAADVGFRRSAGQPGRAAPDGCRSRHARGRKHPDLDPPDHSRRRVPLPDGVGGRRRRRRRSVLPARPLLRRVGDAARPVLRQRPRRSRRRERRRARHGGDRGAPPADAGGALRPGERRACRRNPEGTGGQGSSGRV